MIEGSVDFAVQRGIRYCAMSGIVLGAFDGSGRHYNLVLTTSGEISRFAARAIDMVKPMADHIPMALPILSGLCGGQR